MRYGLYVKVPLRQIIAEGMFNYRKLHKHEPQPEWILTTCNFIRKVSVEPCSGVRANGLLDLAFENTPSFRRTYILINKKAKSTETHEDVFQ